MQPIPEVANYDMVQSEIYWIHNLKPYNFSPEAALIDEFSKTNEINIWFIIQSQTAAVDVYFTLFKN